MGLLDYIPVIEPECEIHTLGDWCVSTVVEPEHYPCVGLLYWRTFPFICVFPVGTFSTAPPISFVLFAWVLMIVFVILAICFKK